MAKEELLAFNKYFLFSTKALEIAVAAIKKYNKYDINYDIDAASIATMSEEYPDFAIDFYDLMHSKDFFFACMCPVVEGLIDLKVKDTQIVAMLTDPEIKKLKDFRHTIFHFQPVLYEKRHCEFYSTDHMWMWVMDLYELVKEWITLELSKMMDLI